MKKLILLGIIILLLMSLSAGASSYLFQQSTAVDLKVSCFDENNSLCTSGTNCYITIYKPNSNVLVFNKSMTYTTTYYNYSLNTSQTSDLGEYTSVVYCSGNSDGFTTFTYEITENGKPNPSSSVIVLFIIMFSIILFYLVFILFYGISKFATFDFNLKDIAYNYGGYFALFGIYMLEPQYLGNADINSFLLLFIKIGAVTNIFLPLIGFAISFIKRRMEFKREENM